MCTAITYVSGDSYFGRNLDLDYSYRETVTITPRNFVFNFRAAKAIETHYAMIGTAFVAENYPLYYDAVNECGLAMAGLNFPNNAVYFNNKVGFDNISPFEFIPRILSQCADISAARTLLERINLVSINFSESLPLSPLHWIIADKKESITVESTAEGLKIYDNPMGVLTNNPPFDFMCQNLVNYRNLSAESSENRFSETLDLPTYCEGMAAIGLPGDYSSVSRFVKASFVKLNSDLCIGEEECVGQFFHLLGAVEMPKGAVRLQGGRRDITVYSSCCNQNRGIYYYTTYDNRQINAVDMYKENLDSTELKCYPMINKQKIYCQN